MHTTIVDVATLAANLDRPDWVVLDCRFDLAKPAWGAEAFGAGHIPGARYLHLEHDLSSPQTATSGRHPLPEPATLAARLGALGIDASTQVVVHDQSNGMYAARAWWLLRYLGHPRVALLAGGLAAWTTAGRTLTTAAATIVPRVFVAQPDASRVIDVVQLQRELAAGAIRLVDARGADRYAGQNETIDPAAGHVPGAVNHPFARNLDANGQLATVDSLRNLWQTTLAGRSPDAMVAMCGSGVSACLNLLAMEHAGLGGARLYPGSWSEWIRDPARPIAKGETP